MTTAADNYGNAHLRASHWQEESEEAVVGRARWYDTICKLLALDGRHNVFITYNRLDG